jgi:Tol biopolymer transport system component
VVASTFQDAGASFSPDGRRIAFESGRSGQGEIWLADADGSNPVQLTRGPGVAQVSPAFSPDGRRVAFTSIPDRGFGDIWVIDIAGGSLRRVTEGPFHEGLPSWSRDGRFLYYGESRADGRDVFRIPVAGGLPERMTHHGGLRPRESPDGKTLFYARRRGTAGTSPLMSRALPDGPERQVVDCIFAWSLETGPDGMYYTGCPLDRGEIPFYQLDPPSGRTRRLGSVPSRGFGVLFLAVSPDGKTILFTKQMAPEADLMLIENFR